MRSKRIEAEITKLYNAVWKKVFSGKRKDAAAEGKSSIVRSGIVRLQTSDEFNKFAKEFAKKLAQQGLNREKGLWRKFYKAAKESRTFGLPETYSDFEKTMMTQAIEHNFKMIKSIPGHVLDVYKQKYTKMLIKQVANGDIGRGTFYRQLTSHGHKNAKLIARTETAKLQTVITQNRATTLGSTAYIWQSTRDIRTRQSHKDMNGVIVLWRTKDDEKPLLDNMNGHAGEFPNCRCTPLPIFDEKDLKGSQFKVYDYRKHKIVTKSKQNVVKLLERGDF